MAQPPKSETLIAIGQLCSSSDLIQNLLVCQKLAREAASKGAKVLFLPEASDYILPPSSSSTTTSISLAQPQTSSPFVAGLLSTARDHELAISVGIHVPNSTATKVLNRSIWISEKGEITGWYDKIHLFDYAAVGLRESAGTEAGSVVGEPLETCVGRVGLLICFDLRFPESSLHLRRLNTQILTYPSAFTIPTGTLHWETLLRARAIETQSYVIAAAQVGPHNEKRRSYGHSMVIDPQGRVLLDMGDVGDEGGVVGIVAIDLERVREAREGLPLGRRIDVYPEL